MELGAGEQRSQRMKSISWQDFVSREGAVVDSLRQFPLQIVSPEIQIENNLGKHT